MHLAKKVQIRIDDTYPRTTDLCHKTSAGEHLSFSNGDGNDNEKNAPSFRNGRIQDMVDINRKQLKESLFSGC
jgi:hypothetical protein